MQIETTTIEIDNGVRVTKNEIEDGRIVYELETALFGRWIPCGSTTIYTNKE